MPATLTSLSVSLDAAPPCAAIRTQETPAGTRWMAAVAEPVSCDSPLPTTPEQATAVRVRAEQTAVETEARRSERNMW